MEAQDNAKEDFLRLVEEKEVKLVNLCHVPEDGRLRALSVAVRNRERLEEIIEFGERADGSSLFSYINPNKSDIYLMPEVETAFFNPFDPTPTLNLLCKYLDEDGKPLPIAPESILQRAEQKLHSVTRVTLKALAELEFYLISRQEETTHPVLLLESNYHQTAPFAEFDNLRSEILTTLEDIGLPTKYGHSEVGRFHLRTGYLVEQHEIEFQPQSLERLARTIVIAKWVVRNVCKRHGVIASFVPKLAVEHAGNGMHIHLCAVRRRENILADRRGEMTDEGRQVIGGILKLSSSLAAFGNTIPPSYLRFAIRKESPSVIFWGTKDRLALVRVPLWWSFRDDIGNEDSCRRTLEFRAPDASSNPYLLLAGISLAAEYGLANQKETEKIAYDLDARNMKEEVEYQSLPLSCFEAAQCLRKSREFYQCGNVFPRRVIDGTIEKLESYNDMELWKQLADKPEKIEESLWEYLHYG